MVFTTWFRMMWGPREITKLVTLAIKSLEGFAKIAEMLTLKNGISWNLKWIWLVSGVSRHVGGHRWSYQYSLPSMETTVMILKINRNLIYYALKYSYVFIIFILSMQNCTSLFITVKELKLRFLQVSFCYGEATSLRAL